MSSCFEVVHLVMLSLILAICVARVVIEVRRKQ